MSAQARSPWRLRPPIEARTQHSPRARRRHARQERRRLAGLDAITGRPLTADATDSPRKRRRLNSSREDDHEDDYEDADIDDDSHEGLVSLEKPAAARYRSVDFDDNIEPQSQEPETRSPQQRFSPSNDGSDGSVGYDAPKDVAGAFPREMAGETTMANEEFTLISGHSLASLKANNSLLATVDDFEPSHLDTVTANSNASQIRPSLYPDVTRLTPRAVAASKEVRNSVAARNENGLRDHDAMSWQPTGRSQHVEHYAVRDTVDRGSTRAYGSPSQRIRSQAREMGSSARHSSYQVPVSSQRQRAQVSSVTKPTVYQPQFSGAALDFDDIWAEEASRSLQDDAQRSHEKAQANTFVPPIFSDEPQPPRRSKIPSTWRKSSGIELSYADSPRSVRQSSQAAATNQDGTYMAVASNGRDERVSTPPSSDNGDPIDDDGSEDGQYAVHDVQEADQEVLEDDFDEQGPLEDDFDNQGALEDNDQGIDDEQEADSSQQSGADDAAQEESELTNPDAAATQLQGVRDKRGNSPATPRSVRDGEDSENQGSGLLWHSNMPTLFSRPPIRPRRPKSDAKVNLSEILRMDMSETAIVPSQSQTDARPDRDHRSLQQHRQERSSSAAANDISSPLARSLFKSSRPVGKATEHPYDPDRGLPAPHISIKRKRDDQPPAEEDMSEQDGEPTRSYQENLNKESPTKLRVDFNDSSLINPGIDLHNYQRKNSPLFDRDPTESPQQAVVTAKPAKKKRKMARPGQPQPALVKPPIPISAPDLAAPPPGLLSRLATSLVCSGETQRTDLCRAASQC
ncbi:hypothetical protein AMS68_002821 [Peltaster fructicola]|uniref:Uncharacterized protein n=1 Tax=Peltaster fructicola TaxID=286661 RepID=A0A6H0XRE7_9PEZI|nr:hypothetical protein AMS68_002821 [Peltaster fructicola]